MISFIKNKINLISFIKNKIKLIFCYKKNNKLDTLQRGAGAGADRAAVAQECDDSVARDRRTQVCGGLPAPHH